MTACRHLTKAIAFMALATASASAASITSNITAPIINDADVANYGAVSGTDKWWGTSGGDNDGRGQTFVTGPGAVRLKSITYQTSTASIPTKEFKIRVGKISGTTFTPVYAETATQSANWSANHYVTWTFTNPPILDGGTLYGVDVIMVSSTTGWQTGIPYVNVTDNEFAGGARYLSASGGAAASLSTGDRIFHLDLETPLGGGFNFVAGNPADNSTGILIRPEIVGTFSQNLVAGTGNITIRNLTNSSDTVLAMNHSAVSISGNLLKIQTAGLINLNKSYAIQINSSALKDASENYFAGIADDITWNFTTAVNDPFLDALTALTSHINGTAVLNDTQIATIFDTIVANKVRFSESAQTINAVFDVVEAYDTAKGASFLLNTGINFGDRTTQAKTSDWTVYQVMQTIVDEIYTPSALATHEALITGFKLGVSANFPGSCPAPGGAGDHRTVTLNASFDDTFGRDTQMWTSPARKPTGTYLPPGGIATVTVPAALVNTGYKIRVGCHSWDLETRRTKVKRLDRATVLYPITSATTKVASPYGGGIYIEVPFRASAGQQSVTVTGAKRSPYFSNKSFHSTSSADWTTERSYLAPWADFQTDKYMTQVPRKWIYNMPHATALASMNDWDLAMDAINNLMGFPLIRGKETMYCQADVILRSSVHAPGYPAVNNLTNPNSEASPTGNANNYLVRGPRGVSTTASHIEFHEQGHAYGFPKFGGESESNVNLLQPAMLNRAFNYSFDIAQRSSLGSNNANCTMNNTAVAWMCVFNFSPREVPMDDSEKAYQHKGHAKFMDVARLFGWDKLDTFWRSYMEDEANSAPVSEETDALLLRLCKAVGKDIRPLFHFWGIHPQNPSALANSIAAASPPITSSIEIRNLLLTYKGLIPANNAAYRTFANAWWGRKPTMGGNWEEREHARQWDSVADYPAGDQQRSEATNPGEIYNENSALDINNRVQELIDLYYPSAITPATMIFAVAPTVINSTTVGMTATNATAAVGPIEYLFDQTSGSPGGTDSAWQTSPSYQDSGLTPGQTYTYNVTARDGLGNFNTTSASFSVTPTAAGDILPPAPSPMTFATPPNTVDEESITMTASSASDFNGVEYYFQNITNNTNSGWQDSPVYTEINLNPLTAYTYQVRARDKSANQNPTSFSAPATANTADLPDETPPQLVSVSPENDSLVGNPASNLVMTFDEPIIVGSGSITLKNLTDATEVAFDINAPEVSFSGTTLTLNPPANLVFNKLYAVQLSSGAVSDIASNPFIGFTDDTSWNFTAILADPIANSGGPYLVPLGNSLTLDASGSQPSHEQTITLYEWDLNNDGTFGDVTGATPAAITDAVLMGTWGMTVGQNTIKLRVTDSAAKTAIATTTVRLGISLSWDANGATANQTDGGGAWLGSNQWRDGAANADWTSGAAATFGNAGTAGAVGLASPTTAASLTFNSFTSTYTVGTAGQALTINSGITNNSGAGITAIVSPIILGGAQTWTNSASTSFSAKGGINNNGHTLTITGAGNVDLGDSTTNIITGAGGITMNGTGKLTLSAAGTTPPAHNFSGALTINAGAVGFQNTASLGSGNIELNGGVLAGRFGSSVSRALGSAAGQIRITGGVSGWSGEGTSVSTLTITGTGSNPLVWGSVHFAPSVFVLQGSNANANGVGAFANNINLNGADRTIRSDQSGTGSGTFSGVISNSTGTAGLIKTGPGRHNLNGTNSYNGGTTLQAGTLQLGNAFALGSTSGPLTVNGGLLNLNDQTISIGNLTGIGGTIANNGGAARTLTIGTGNGGGGIYQGVIADKTGSGTGTVALTKTGSGTIHLTGTNTYTGATVINGGILALTGATQATTGITFTNNSSLGLVIGTPVTAASAAVNLADGRISVTGTPSSASHILLTAFSVTGTPVLATAIPGYELAVVGNQLLLNQIITDPYAVWSGGAAFGDDTNNDGVDNGLAFLLGAPNPNTNATGLLPTVSNNGGNLVITFNIRNDRGTAAASVQHSSDVAVNDPWESALVPNDDATVNDVVFDITAGLSLNTVQATIPANKAAGGKLFGRVIGSGN